jgi:hypothetical protein
MPRTPPHLAGVLASMFPLAEAKRFRVEFLGRGLDANNLLDHDIG